jgi:hypothetical protein
MRAQVAGLVVSVMCLPLGLLMAVPAEAQVSGKYRIVQTNGRVVEGEVTEEGDSYVVVQKVGEKGSIRTVVRKNVVRELIPLDEASAGEEGSGEAGEGGLTAEELKTILGPDTNFSILEEFGETSGNAMDAAPADDESIEQMRRIAGPKADVLMTDHFAFVYTSERRLAVELAARLEAVYRWNVRFMELCGIPSQRPERKLEIYFFGTHKEFRAYQALDLGVVEMGILGFYMPPTNRSAFFVMHDYPPFAAQLEAAKDKNIDYRERQRRQNQVDRMADYYNLEVVQHESAHHIHFNIGLFNRRGDSPKWLVEGMAQMFECPPSALGASLGTTNHYRLKEFRQIWGKEREKFDTGYLQHFLWSRPRGEFGAADYPLGWALCHYLWRTKKEGFAKFLKAISELEDDVTLNPTERQKMWEDAFGPLTEEWEKAFLKYLNEIPLRTDHLPDLPTGP